MKNVKKQLRSVQVGFLCLLIGILLTTAVGCRPMQQDPISTDTASNATDAIVTPSPTPDAGDGLTTETNTTESPAATSAATPSDPATTAATASTTSAAATETDATATAAVTATPSTAASAAPTTSTTAPTQTSSATAKATPTATKQPTATKTTTPKTATPKPTTPKPTTPKPTTPKPTTAKPTATPQPTMQVNKNYAQQVLTLVNAERAKEGLKPLTMTNSALIAAAELRAEECVIKLSHTRPNGESCFTVLDEFNISWWTVGENIAAGYATPEQVVTGWMNSSGHRANILTAEFTEIGIGCVIYNGGYYWTQIFIG